MKPFPLIINDVVRVDCCRIKRVLAEDDLICSDDQAEQLRTALKTLPVNDCDLIRLLRRFVSINWELYPYLVEPTFRDLAAKHTEMCRATGRQKVPEIELRKFEAKMFRMTAGLVAHPKWWDFPCQCNSCRAAD